MKAKNCQLSAPRLMSTPTLSCMHISKPPCHVCPGPGKEKSDFSARWIVLASQLLFDPTPPGLLRIWGVEDRHSQRTGTVSPPTFGTIVILHSSPHGGRLADVYQVVASVSFTVNCIDTRTVFKAYPRSCTDHRTNICRQ